MPPSKSKLKRLQKRDDDEQVTTTPPSPTTPVDDDEDGFGNEDADASGGAANGGDKSSATKSQHLYAQGILTSHPGAPDIRMEKVWVTQYGQDLCEDAELVLVKGQRYGLIGMNGCGKSSLMTALGKRLLPVPEHVSTFYMEGECPATDLTALQTVLSAAEDERKRIEAQLDEIESQGKKADMDRIEALTHKLDQLPDEDEAKARAAYILSGLDFSLAMQQKPTREFSGGWRMRIALAMALFMQPDLLLLDGPTNHLDLETCVWLENYLSRYKGILVLVSHSQDLMDEVCSSMLLLRNRKLAIYGGNYSQYKQTREEQEVNQMKQYNKEQDELKAMKEYVARFGHGTAKLARQGKSKEKLLNKMVEKGLTEKVTKDRTLRFRFPPCGQLTLPVLHLSGVAFAYPGSAELYNNVDLSVDQDSRVAIVGRNGTGKSTVLKLMLKQLQPSKGVVVANGHLRIGHFHQHLAESLPADKSALEYLLQEFPDEYDHNSAGIEVFRTRLGPYGLSGNIQTAQIGTLSAGQRIRIAFAKLALENPHVLLLDEPTNHLDVETIDSLADALNNWGGGVVIVSHDFRLLEQCCNEIWLCADHGIRKFKGTIQEYKAHLKDELGLKH